MNVLIIALETESSFKPEYAAFDKVLEDLFGDHIQLAETTFAIKTDDKVAEVFKSLKNHAPQDANLIIITVCQPGCAQAPPRILEWLHKNLQPSPGPCH